jgi:hypothetical protein
LKKQRSGWIVLGGISAVATLILFVIYFVGRCIVIGIEKKVCYDEVAYISAKDSRCYNIVDQIDTVSSNGDDETNASIKLFVLTSRQGIRNIETFKICYDDGFKRIAKLLKVASCDFLNVGQSFAIKVFVPEIFPEYRIVFHTQDFKKVTLDISDNLKSGVVSEMLRPKHTFKSILYYLFK